MDRIGYKFAVKNAAFDISLGQYCDLLSQVHGI
jgi:hypothetical protein